MKIICRKCDSVIDPESYPRDITPILCVNCHSTAVKEQAPKQSNPITWVITQKNGSQRRYQNIFLLAIGIIKKEVSPRDRAELPTGQRKLSEIEGLKPLFSLLEESDRLASAQDKLKQEKQAVEAEHAKGKRRNGELKKRLTELNRQKELIDQQFKQVTGALKDTGSVIATLREEYSTALKDVSATAAQKIVDLEAQLAQVKQELSVALGQASKSEADRAILQHQFDEVMRQKDEAAQQLSHARSELSNIKEQVVRFEQDCKSLHVRLSESSQSLDALRQEKLSAAANHDSWQRQSFENLTAMHRDDRRFFKRTLVLVLILTPTLVVAGIGIGVSLGRNSSQEDFPREKPAHQERPPAGGEEPNPRITDGSLYSGVQSPGWETNRIKVEQAPSQDPIPVKDTDTHDYSLGFGTIEIEEYDEPASPEAIAQQASEDRLTTLCLSLIKARNQLRPQLGSRIGNTSIVYDEVLIEDARETLFFRIDDRRISCVLLAPGPNPTPNTSN